MRNFGLSSLRTFSCEPLWSHAARCMHVPYTMHGAAVAVATALFMGAAGQAYNVALRCPMKTEVTQIAVMLLLTVVK